MRIYNEKVKKVNLDVFQKIKLGFKGRREIRDLFNGKVGFREENELSIILVLLLRVFVIGRTILGRTGAAE